MMTLSYKQHTLAEAKSLDLPDLEVDYLLDYELMSCSGIWLYSDDVPLKLIGEDGGEPEDQTLRRDWRWVVDALNEALNTPTEGTQQ
jgi:hypothetical protein